MDKSSDNEKAAKDLHVQRPWLKRSSSVLRDCDAGEAFSDGRMVKKMKEADYEGAQHLTNDKQTTDYEDKKCPRREPIRRSDGIIVKKQNYCGKCLCIDHVMSVRIMCDTLVIMLDLLVVM